MGETTSFLVVRIIEGWIRRLCHLFLGNLEIFEEREANILLFLLFVHPSNLNFLPCPVYDTLQTVFSYPKAVSIIPTGSSYWYSTLISGVHPQNHWEWSEGHEAWEKTSNPQQDSISWSISVAVYDCQVRSLPSVFSFILFLLYAHFLVLFIFFVLPFAFPILFLICLNRRFMLIVIKLKIRCMVGVVA